MNRAVFLDRDGTINAEKRYVHRIEDFEFLPGAVEAIRLLNRKGYKVIVVTNQAGVARGYYAEEDVEKLHEWLIEELRRHDASVDGIYYCPHHEQHGLGEYKTECSCRKPKPGMIQAGIRDFTVDPALSFTIGDKESDLAAGKRAGTRTILVRTGYGGQMKTKLADYTAVDLLEAVQSIIP